MPYKFDPLKGVKVDGNSLIDDDGTLSADVVTNANIADDAVSLEHLDAGITPSHIVAYAGILTMGGGAASEAETVTGVAATDIVIAQISDNSTNDDVSLLEVKPTTNTLTFLFNEDPGANVKVSYAVYRAVA